MEIAARRPPRASVLVLSNLPAIAAWLLLAGGGGARLSEVQALGGFLLAFAVHGAWDARASDAPAWHRRLRVGLTLGACLALALALGTTLTA
jgi:RsiW-degrading membrane proteinase PrsW (M82 family)